MLAVQICSVSGLIRKEPFNADIVRVWLPVNAIFVGMIGTSFWALKSLNVAMLTGRFEALGPGWGRGTGTTFASTQV